MTMNVVEAASLIIDNPSIHGVTREFPWLVDAIIEKKKWWKDDVKTIAAVDAIKPTNDILRLGWVEYNEAEHASSEDVLVELGDMIVFLVAAIVRDVVAGHDPSGVVKMEEIFIARYVDEKLSMYENPGLARAEMIESVFAKIKSNFHPALNPPAPADFGHVEKNIVYQASYMASRALRKHAIATGEYDPNKGMPKEWETVYRAVGEAPEKLSQVKALAFQEMINVGIAFLAAYGEAHADILVGHWYEKAPLMTDDLRMQLSI